MQTLAQIKQVVMLVLAGLLLAACQLDVSPGEGKEPSEPQSSQPPEQSSDELPPPEAAETILPEMPQPSATETGFSEASSEEDSPIDEGEITPLTETPTAPAGSDPWSVYPPAPEDAWMDRGNFFAEEITLLPVAGQPGQARLWVQGFLPTPCNQPRAHVSLQDEQNRIVVELYSVIPRDRMCVEMIKPFSGLVATLSGLPGGSYKVIVDEQEIGTLNVP